MTKPTPLQSGDQLHFVVSGFTFAATAQSSGGRTSERGQTVTVTDVLLEMSQDRHGKSWLDLVDDAPGQVARWGHEVFRRGPAPAEMEVWTPDSPEWEMAREHARKEAWALPVEEDRNAALQAVRDRYGAGPSTASYDGAALFS